MDRPKYYIEQLAEYFKKNIKKGYTLEALKQSLLNQGYSKFSVDQAVQLMNKQLSAEAPKLKERPQITYKVIDGDEAKPNLLLRIWRSLFG
jgi:hypothetical protein